MSRSSKENYGDDSRRFQQSSRASKRNEARDEARQGEEKSPPESLERRPAPPETQAPGSAAAKRTELSRLKSPPNPVNQSFHPDRPEPSSGPSRSPEQPRIGPYEPILPPDFDPRAPWPPQKKKILYQFPPKKPDSFSKDQIKTQEDLDMMEHLVDIIRLYEPDFSRELTDKPTAIVNAIQKILAKLDEEWRYIPLEFEEMKGLMGTRWSYEVKKLEARVTEIIDDHVRQRSALVQEIAEKDAEIRRMKKQVANSKELVNQCRFKNLRPDKRTLVEERAHLKELRYENRLLQEEVAMWKEQVETMAARSLAKDREQAIATMGQMAECVDMVKEIKDWATDELMRYVSEQISEYSKCSKEEVEEAAKEQIELLKLAFVDVQDKINELKETSRMLDKDYAEYLAIVQNLSGHCTSLSYEAKILEELVGVREEQKSSLISEVQELDETNSYLAFRCGADKTSTPLANLQYSMRSPDQFQWGYPPSPNLQYSMGSPEQFRQGSPFSAPYDVEDILDIHSISLEDSGSGPGMPSFNLTPPSPMRSPNIFTSTARSNIVGPGTQTLSQPPSRITVDPLTQTRRSISIGPGTQPLSQPQSRFTIDPSTQNVSGVTSRLDIGRGLNMHTVHSGPPSPYYQVTRVDSTLSPQPGPSRMLDSPLHVQHRANITPPRFITPWISTQSRYGYTDPSFKMLNMPPGGFLEMNTALKKQVMLMSPRREEPLLVNIDVDPKPLVLTEDGEHFICDISLDVQQAGRQIPPHISPVYTYGEPPLITPTADRRQGPFTPTSIFKKHHYNRAVIEDRFDDSPGRYFQPHYLPHDGRSPLSHLSPVSSLGSDRTISWERIPGVERTPSPVIKGYNRGYLDSSSDYSDSSFERTPPSQRSSPSPVIRGIVDMSSSYSDDGSFQRSASPLVNRTFEQSPSPRLDGTFERSQSPVIRGIVDMSSSYSDDGSFERSASPLVNRTFERSPSPRLDGTFEGIQSPMIRGIVDMSSSYSDDGSFERSASPLVNRTFERSPSPRLDGTFEGSQSPMIRGIVDMSSSYSDDGSFERSASPLVNRTFERSPSPRLDGTFEGSQSPVIRGYVDTSSSLSNDGSFERSASPLINRTFERSPSPLIDGSFDGSPSPRRGVSFDPLNTVYRFRADDSCLDMISSPSTDGSFNRSVSPRMNTTFERSQTPSPLSRVYRFNTTQGRGYLDMTSSSSNSGRFDGSASPSTDGSFDRSASPSTDGSFDRSVSPRMNSTFEQSQRPSPLNRVYRFNTTQGRGYLDMTSSSSNSGRFDGSASPQMNTPSERSSSPFMDRTWDSHAGRFAHEDPFCDGVLNQTFDSHMYGPSENDLSRSMPSVGSLSHSMSPRTFNSDMSSCNSGYDNPFNPNNSVLSPTGMSPHDVFNTSMPPRMGGVFSNNPSRLTRTY